MNKPLPSRRPAGLARQSSTTSRFGEVEKIAPVAGRSGVRAPRLDSLTGLRFLAAAMVLVHHFANFVDVPALAWFRFGATGVTFFFILSGFVLTWSFTPADTLPRFYWRRAARIWPMHLVATVLAVPVFYSLREISIDWPVVVASALLLHAWWPVSTTYFGGNPAAWSLSCEVFFYALHPLVVRPLLQLSARAAMHLAIATALGFGAFAFWARGALPAETSAWLLYVSPPYRVGQFLLGVLLAVALRQGGRVPIGRGAALGALALWLVALYILPLVASIPAELSRLLVGSNDAVLPLLYGGVIAASAQADLDRKPSLLTQRPMMALGEWSYALYLTHATLIYLLIALIGRRAPDNGNIVWLGAVGLASIGIACVCYRLVEHPAERWLRARQPVSARTERVAAGAGT